jgi:hypothetical protein
MFVRNAKHPCKKRKKRRSNALLASWKSALMETQADLNREAQVIKRVCNHFNCEALKLPTHQRLDFALTRQADIVAFAEIKVRRCASDAYKTAMIHLDKVIFAHQLSDIASTPAFLFIQWTDGLGYVDFKSSFYTRLGGRTDRGIVKDYSLVAHYPMENFKFIGEK